MSATIVRFVDALPEKARRATKWTEVLATLAGQPGQWALLDAKGGYPRQRLQALGCEVRTVTIDGETQMYARVVSSFPDGQKDGS